MKITAILLLIAFTQVSAVTYSQSTKLNLNYQNVKLSDLLHSIESVSDYRFFYDSRAVDLSKTVSVNSQDSNLKEVLDKILGSDLIYEMVNNNIVVIKSVKTNPIGASLSQQIIKITGRVTDSSGSPIPGVSVIIKGTTQGMVTNVNGNYSLSNVPRNATLVFSFVGMKTQEVSISGKTSVDVIMKEETIGIEEVVAVGFGTQKKVNLTGSVGTINSDELKSRPVKNVQSALQGVIPGLNIQQTDGRMNVAPKLNIRGVATIGSGSRGDALILIDGVEGDLSLINPQDIENVSILKDAAASSIYGSRAPFGVVLITTKKGSKDKPKVSYSGNLQYSAPSVMPETMDSYTFSTFLNDAADNSGTGRFVSDERLKRIKDYQKGIISTVSIPDPTNPTVWANGNSYGNANVDIFDVYYKNWAKSHEHNLSVSGGTQHFTFYLSFGYLDKDGLLKIADDRYKRYTPTATIEAQVTDWMKLRYTTRFVRVDYGHPTLLIDGMFGGLARQGWPFLPVFDDNGYYYPANSPLLGLVEGGRTNEQTDTYNNHASMEIEPLKNWTTTVDLNYNIKTYTQHAVQLKTYHHNVAGDPIVKRQDSFVQNDLLKQNFLNMNVYSTYHFKLNNLHNFTVMAGTQLENMKYSYFMVNRSGVIVDDLPVVDLTSGLNFDGTAATPSVRGNMSEWSTAGYFGRLNYNYKEKYLLEANIRDDGSSRFQKEKRWNWFPSFSAGWNIAREDFWNNLANRINLLKFRLSYGELGNQNTDSWYPTYQVISTSMNSGLWLQKGLNTNIAFSPELISSSLTWEKINTLNAGIDMGAFDNRLTGSFDYYVRKTLNMVGPAIELPNILGKSVPKSNNTDLKTSGVELELSWHDRLDNGLSYGARLTFWDSQTKIVRYPNEKKLLSTYIAGQKYGDIWGYETIGIAKSNEEMQAHLANLPQGGQNALGSNWAAGDIMYKDLNNDGKISTGAGTLDDPGDMKIIGNTTPRYQFGLDLNGMWKNFDFRIFLQGVGKRDYWTASDMFFGCSYGGLYQMVGLKQHEDYFRLNQSNDLPANLDAYYPRPLMNGAIKNEQRQTRYLQNAAYIRLKNLSVGYTLPQSLTNKLYGSKIRLSFSGENLLTLTKMSSIFDPESIDGIIGREGAQYPLEKVLSFRLDISL